MRIIFYFLTQHSTLNTQHSAATKQQGSIMVLAMFLLVFISALLSATTFLNMTRVRTVRQIVLEAKAKYLARAGIEEMINRLKNKPPYTWELGKPANVGPTTAPAGEPAYPDNRCWGTKIDANYLPGIDSETGDETGESIATMPIDLSVSGVTSGATLSFYHWYDFANVGGTTTDGGWVEISDNGGSSWTQITPLGSYPATISTTYTGIPSNIRGKSVFSGAQTSWVEVSFNFNSGGAYTGKKVMFRFRFYSFGTTGGKAGWYVDRIRVTKDGTAEVFFDNEEDDATTGANYRAGKVGNIVKALPAGSDNFFRARMVKDTSSPAAYIVRALGKVEDIQKGFEAVLTVQGGALPFQVRVNSMTEL